MNAPRPTIEAVRKAAETLARYLSGEDQAEARRLVVSHIPERAIRQRVDSLVRRSLSSPGSGPPHPDRRQVLRGVSSAPLLRALLRPKGRPKVPPPTGGWKAVLARHFAADAPEPLPVREIAERLGVSPLTVYRAATRLGVIRTPGAGGTRGPGRPISPVLSPEAEAVRQLLAQGMSQARIAEARGVSRQAVSLVVGRLRDKGKAPPG